MNPLVTGLIVALLGRVAVMEVAELIGEQYRAELDRWPLVILRHAVRRLPTADRAELLDEWSAELFQILHDPQARPLLRFCRGARYSLGLLRAAPHLSVQPHAQLTGSGRSADLATHRLISHENFVTILIARETPLIVGCAIAGRSGLLLAALRMTVLLHHYWISARVPD